MNVLGWLTVIVQLIFLEGILSIDNAAVLGELWFEIKTPPLVQFGLSIAIVLFALLYAHWPRLQILQPLFRFCQEVMRVSLLVFRRIVIQPAALLFSLLALLWQGN